MYKNLEKELSKTGFKKKDIAEALGVRRQTIYDKINGKYEFTLKEANKIIEIFFPGFKIDYLFEITIEDDKEDK